ncbi:sulfotransferase domain-containing protein, partial [Aliarcobacter butzleri]|uniref:sulfotransferase domain-containing protein n=1 Tax=Aliarcobacter butzleri TaxID=28197 RepID=UPI0021B44346
MIVWLASYPRSGNTFFRVILNSVFGIKTYSIYDDKGDIGAEEKTSEVVGHEFLPQNFDIEKARFEEKIYYIKTHELLDNRVKETDKVIYLIRDGREATLSFTKHQNTFSKQNKKLKDTIYGNTFIGSWGEHVSSWSPKNRENTLLIKFEELTKEPIKFIEILSNFLEVNPIGNDIPTFEELKKINPKFFRSGKTNSWENIFTQEEHISFWMKNYKQMDEYGYDYKKPDNFDELLTNNILNLESVRQNSYIIKLILEENKNIQSINQRFNRLNQELEQKQKVIEQKNNELKEKNQELEQKQKVIEQKNNELKEKNQEL